MVDQQLRASNMIDVNSDLPICRNSSCRANLPANGVFCQRCSCYICGQYDETKDPSLWLMCEPDSAHDFCCRLTCHIECAFGRGNLGVVTTGEFTPLDGSYWCTSCGKISDILGCWKQQLSIAKDAVCVDVLCYRVNLSYRLLNGTSRFSEIHEIVKIVKSKLEAELGPIDQCTYEIGQGIVSRLSVAFDVQKLCAVAIEKADGWMASREPGPRVGPFPPACRVFFQEISSSSIVMILVGTSTTLMDSVKGYDIWCWRSQREVCQTEPNLSFPAYMRRVKISNLQPSCEYAVRIISYMEAGTFSVTEVKCITKRVNIIQNKPNLPTPVGVVIENPCPGVNSPDMRGDNASPSGVNGTFVPVCTEQTSAEQGCGLHEAVTRFQSVDDTHSCPTARALDLNDVTIPDLNEDPTPPFEPSEEELNICEEPAVGGDKHDASGGIQKNAEEKDLPEKSSSRNEDNGMPFEPLTGLDKMDIVHCIKIICWLEREGHIKQEFRVKFLTWFSFKSTQDERKVVYAYVNALSCNPKDLGEQLQDTFTDVIH